MNSHSQSVASRNFAAIELRPATIPPAWALSRSCLPCGTIRFEPNASHRYRSIRDWPKQWDQWPGSRNPTATVPGFTRSCR
jgi:hypothetical protein